MIKKILPLLLLAVIVYACSSDSPENPTTPTDNFDRGVMLTHLADNIIIPSFEDFQNKLENLQTKATAFTNTPDAATLAEARSAWLNAYKAWQHVEMFNIGKAEEIGFVNFFNIYPLTVADVEKNVKEGSYDLNSPNNHDAQGFPALDYLLYGVADNDTAILAKYTNDENASKYKKYVNDVITQMSRLTSDIVNDWKGSYRNQFVSSTGNTANSSLNKLVNDFIFYYEKGLRANKFGIPAGVWSSTSLPEKVEAYFNKEASKELALEALTSVKNFFNGVNFNQSGSGSSFKNYLTYLKRDDLISLINNQLNKATSQVNTLNKNFYEQINADNTKMTNAYDELQKVVVYLKVDMLQAFDISIDYVDADGD